MRANLNLLPVGLFLVALNQCFGQPVITEQPVNQTNILGSTASFTLSATGTPEPLYQWQILNGDWTNLGDRTNATLVLYDVRTGADADYRAVITDDTGTTNSAVAHLYVVAPPGNVVVSADQVVIAGANKNLTVQASGTWLSYQWRRDGVDVTGATNSLLAFSNVQPTNAGAYTVLVTNLAGTITSKVCQLSVAAGSVFTNAQGTQLPYRLFLPPRYDPATNYPLVLFWHGAGEVGTDNVRQLQDNGQFSFLAASNLAKFPCFYLAPQVPYSLSGCAQYYTFLDCSTNLLSFLKDQFPIDPDRIYVTGLSMGGFLSWNMLARYPEVVAAAVPMSGGLGCTSISDALLNARLPIWNFHGANDGTIAVSYSDSVVAGLRNAGANVIYTRYLTGGHGIWPTAYRTPWLVDWVMGQRRGVSGTNEPLLLITQPTASSAYRTGATNFALAGTAAALGSSTAISWSNVANHAKSAALGSNTWTAAGIPLVAEQTNLIIVTGATSSWAPNYGGSTTFNDTLAVTPSPAQLTLTLDGTEAFLNWTGGVPPLHVQRATDLTKGDWTNFLINATPPVPLSLTNPTAFYRLVGN